LRAGYRLVGPTLRGMPVEFLTDDEAAEYGRYAGVPSQAELEKIFFLDDEDRALIDRRRGSHMKLGFDASARERAIPRAVPGRSTRRPDRGGGLRRRPVGH
jgi:Domain of unknown function (DUF4158)